MMVLDLMAMNSPIYLNVRPPCNVMTMTRPDLPNVVMDALLSNVGVNFTVHQHAALGSTTGHRLAPRGWASVGRLVLVMSWFDVSVAKALMQRYARETGHEATMAPNPSMGMLDMRHEGGRRLALTSPTGRACNPVAPPAKTSRGPPTRRTRLSAGSSLAAISPTGRL